jgi:hypothetical protein
MSSQITREGAIEKNENEQYWSNRSVVSIKEYQDA